MPQEPLEKLFANLWEPYYQQNPQVPAIHTLIAEREQTEQLYNDHIALRTFQHPRVGLEVLAESFTSLGFIEKDSFHLTDKKVFAKYYRHPSGKWPRVFISELLIKELSDDSQKMIHELVEQVPQHMIENQQICFCGRQWDISFAAYEKLQKENEYAAWMGAHGYQMNHATLSVNKLNSFESLEELNSFLKENGYTLNGASEGKEVQVATDDAGEVLLKQSSTVASEVSVLFDDGPRQVPGCYYEFLQRFQDYDSFDPGNASKIMESTNVQS